MAEKKQIEIIDVNEDNVSEEGFFCYMSKRKSEGFQRKLDWLKARFAEGMRIKIIKEGGRGFIEYIPGEYAWRPVKAKGYMFIHCLWVVGKSKGKGCGALLLNECIKDAKKAKMKGVAVVTSEGNWLVGRAFYENLGFESVDEAPPSFELMVKKFGKARSPSFAGDWDIRLKSYKKGLTILRTDQCPYLPDAVNILVDAAKELGIKSRVIDLRDARDVRNRAPTPFGVFNVVYNGEILSYHYLTRREFLKRLGD